MRRTVFILVMVTLISKTFGFCRDIILSYCYGATNISDAYLISLTIPTTIFAFIGVGISTCFVPMYSRIIEEKNAREADNFTNHVINFMFVVCTLIVIICLLFTVPSVKLFASGFKGTTLEMAVHFTRINIFAVYFWTMIYIIGAYLQVKNKFLAAAAMGIPFNVFIIISIIMSTRMNINILPIGSVIAVVFQFLFLIPFAYKQGYRYKFHYNINNKYLKKMIFLSLPLIIGVSVNQINILVDKTIASQVAVGGISVLNYASKLNDFIQGVFVLSITSVMYPSISKMAAEKDIEPFKKSILQAMNGINIFVIPSIIGLMIFSEPVTRLLFGRGAFNTLAISMTSKTMFFYSLGMIAIGQREVLSRAFYSLQDTKTPMINAAIALCMNIVLSITLSKFIGLSGIALATSVSATFCMLLLFMNLRRKIGPLGMKHINVALLKILSASLTMGMLDKIMYYALGKNLNSSLALMLSMLIGVLIYLFLIWFLKINEAVELVTHIKVKFRMLITSGTKQDKVENI